MAKQQAKTPTLKQPAKKLRTRQQVKKGPHRGSLIVLVEDVLHVGKQGQVVEVKAGYARNYLIPNGYAVVPTEHNLKLLEKYKIRVQQLREARVADLKSLAEQIMRTQRVTIEANSNEEGHLYGSVAQAEITRAMRGKNLLVEPDMVKGEIKTNEQGQPTVYEFEPLKECGIYQIYLALGYEIVSQIEVTVVPQAAGPATGRK